MKRLLLVILVVVAIMFAVTQFDIPTKNLHIDNEYANSIEDSKEKLTKGINDLQSVVDEVIKNVPRK